MSLGGTAQWRFCPQSRTKPLRALRYLSAMNADATQNDEQFSIHDSSEILGLEPFSVYSLIHRRKLNTERTLLGELVISRSELGRVLGDHAKIPPTSVNRET
jgi:hypothetical protein